MTYKSVMITFSKSQQRLNNYNDIKKIIPNLELFEATDAINNFEECKKDTVDNNYCTEKYLNYCKKLPGKLGCNLSHIKLLKDFLTNSTDDWMLVIEDDVNVNNFNSKIIEYLIADAVKIECNFIQLYTNPIFLQKQLQQPKINYKLFKMLSQWGTVSYLINKVGAHFLLSTLPWNANVDIVYSSYIKDLNSLCFINNIFINKGSSDSTDKKAEFGSLIWANKLK